MTSGKNTCATLIQELLTSAHQPLKLISEVSSDQHQLGCIEMRTLPG